MNGEGLVAAALVVGGFAYLAMAWYVWLHRKETAAPALVVVLLSVFVWTVGYAIELTTRTTDAAQLWSSVKYIGIVSLSPSLLAFAVEYTGRGRRLSPAAIALLVVEPAIVLTVLWVPAWHDLMLPYDPSDLAATQAGLRLDTYPQPGTGVLFWPHAVYNYIVLTSAAGLLISRLARMPYPYRHRAGTLIGATVLPLAGNLAYNRLLIAFDPTPFLLVMFAVILVWNYFRTGRLDLVPVARNVVLEQMADGVLVLDEHLRVVDANPAAAGLLGLPREQVQGRDARDVVPFAAGLVQTRPDGAPAQHEVSVPAQALGRSGPEVRLSLVLSALTDRRGAQAGRLLVMRDITQLTVTERRLREMLEAEQHLAAVLATSLRPASLPNVPRLHLAARSLPAGQGQQVSGDFYDVHQALGGDWAFVLGDVAGKGVHAAVVTSMARYTVRTLSAQGWSPKQVIEQLNQALLVEAEPERFCTVVYGRISERDGDGPSAGVRLTIALGGHPPPLIRRVDGSVEAVGLAGTALGIVSLIDVQEVTVDLLPGEVLLAYTDGVTEARRDGDEFGELRLAQTLSGAAVGLRGKTGSAAASLVCEAVADRVVEVVTSFASHRDDVAVLVLAVS